MFLEVLGSVTGKRVLDLTCGEVSATDETFQMTLRTDIATAMYLFHYARSVKELDQMADLIGRNLEPGGKFVNYTNNPDYDFTGAPDDMEERIGFH